MKRATGELNLTVVVLVAIGAILGFFMLFKDTMFSSAMAPTCCILSKGTYKNGICETNESSKYQECMGGGTIESSNKQESENKFIKGSDSIDNSNIINNIKDSGVENSINGDLSISNSDDNRKADEDNKELNKKSTDNIKDIMSNTTGNAKGENSGQITGENEEEIKNKASNGLNTKGDYSKSRITNTTSNYSSDKSSYTTTSTVKSNTSNYQMNITYTYQKNKSGSYELTGISWKESRPSEILVNGYEKELTENGDTIKHSYNGVLKGQYNTEKLNSYIDENGTKIYNELSNRVVFLDTYSGDRIVENANGVFINPGVIVTTWNFLKKSVINGDKLIVTNSEGGNYSVDGIISINTELDLAFIKLKEKIGDKTEFGNVYDLKVEAIDFTICTDNDYKLEVKYGYLLKRGGLITSLITLERNEEGSPLFDYNKKLIGINTANVLKSSTSIARSTNYIKNLQSKLEKQDFTSIKVTSFKDLKNKYINENNETEDNTIPKDIWNKYKRIGDVENTITLNLIKSSYDDNIVSLRYVNDISDYSDNFALADNFINKLIKQEYKKKHSSTYKIIYQKGNSKVILLSEFNYLIIIMTGV
ncbi:MAG: hypothetical protein ACI4OT_00440 [Bacilli bacterium]